MNAATVSRLASRYQGQVDFIHIDWNDPDSDPVIDYFHILRRSTYLLLTPTGRVEHSWIGTLDEQVVDAEILEMLAMFAENQE